MALQQRRSRVGQLSPVQSQPPTLLPTNGGPKSEHARRRHYW